MDYLQLCRLVVTVDGVFARELHSDTCGGEVLSESQGAKDSFQRLLAVSGVHRHFGGRVVSRETGRTGGHLGVGDVDGRLVFS